MLIAPWHQVFDAALRVAVEDRSQGGVDLVDRVHGVFHEGWAGIWRELGHAFHTVLGSHFADVGRQADGSVESGPTCSALNGVMPLGISLNTLSFWDVNRAS